MKSTALLLRLMQLTVAPTSALLVFPFVWFGCRWFGRPPTLAYPSQLFRFLRYAWTENPTDPSFTFGTRLRLSTTILMTYSCSIIGAVAWILDEFLYGKQLDTVLLEKPFFLISGARSGSTQLARYLEQDPNLVVPCLIMTIFPYVWLWKLVPWTLGRFISKEQVLSKILEALPPEGLKRHEADPFRVDTFDPAFLMSHLNSISLQMGPVVATIEFNFAEFAPHNRSLMEKDYIEFIDRVARKTLFFYGGTSQHRFFLKGHFISIAPFLAKKYPDCSMLTVVRDPLERIQSAIHFIRLFSEDSFVGPIPWNWLTRMVEAIECRYCEVEKEWFGDVSPSNVAKCVVSFDDFVQDLPGVMSAIYKEMLGLERVPKYVPITHDRKDRSNYKVNRSLEDLGIDEDVVKRRLANYLEWMRSKKKNSAWRGC
jgi:Sulfotransferase family